MKLLKQNYHGLPGLGVNGQTGQTGDRGNSIYFGFINDFFDGQPISVETYVYAAKRLMLAEGQQDDVVDLINRTVGPAWRATEAELYQYYNASLNMLIKNSSNDFNDPYINFKTFYYTGNRLSSSTMLNSSMIQSYGGDSSVKEAVDEAKGVELDINGDYISMSFMLSSLNNDLKDVSQYNFDNDLDVGKPLDQSENLLSLSSMYHNIEHKISHYEFTPDAAIKISKQAPGDNRSAIPYDTDDAIYYNSSIIGDLYETGQFLDNVDCSQYYTNYEDTSITYTREDIKNPFYSDSSAILDGEIYEGKIIVDENENTFNRYNAYIPDNVKGIEEDNAKQHWETVFKTAEKINKNEPIAARKNIIEEGDLLDSDNNAYYGMPTRIIFNRNNNQTTDINDSSTSKISEFNNYYDQSKQYYSERAGVVVSTDNSSIYYSLSKDDTEIFIPFTLSSQYKVGDVLYFYTDQYQFNNTHNIEYMVVITEDLLNCTPDKLQAAAIMQDPLDTKMFNEILDGRLSSFYNVAILYDNDSSVYCNDLKKLSNRSFISIADEYTKSPLMLCSNVSFGSMNASIGESIKKAYVKFKDNKFTFNINQTRPKIGNFPEIQLKMNNLYINTTNLTSLTNVELNKFVYDSNIILYKNNFIKPLLDIDLYYDNNSMYSSVFVQTISAEDYFYNVDKLDDYFYGCDIYNKDMEKIDTITSTEKELVVKIVPNVNNDVYYIQMFASYGAGLKYYSKLSKLSITYSNFKYLNKIKKMKLPTGYDSAIGKFSTESSNLSNDSLNDYINSKRQQITSFKIDIIGDDQKITREKLSGNIIFSVSNITAEACNNASINIYPNDDNIEIDSVMFNHRTHTSLSPEGPVSPLSVNDWSYIVKNNINSYKLDLSTNLPIFIGDPSAATTMDEYMLKGSSNSEDTESPLFANLKNGYIVESTKQRSILVTVKYKFKDSDEYYYENFNIVQPGFEDTRDIPKIELNAHSNITDLQTFNSIENNVLPNQFVTYLDINISDFKKCWGKFTNVSDVSLDLTIHNLQYDLNWQNNYVIQRLTDRRTFRGIYEINDDFRKIRKLNNYVKFNVDVVESSLTNDNISIDVNSKLYDNEDRSYNPAIIDEFGQIPDESNPTKSNGKYIMFDWDFINVMRTSKNINSGLQNDIYINLTGIKIKNDQDKIRLKLTTEFGNPIIANMYYRFYVKNIKINVANSDKFFYTLVPESISETAQSTYLCNIDTKSYANESNIVKLKYKYISDSIDVTFNPLSYTITPEDVESSYTNIYGDIYKYGITEQITKELKFFNSNLYSTNEYVFDASAIRDNIYYDFKNLLVKKSYIQDNVKNINVKPTSLYDLIKKTDISGNKSTKINDQLYIHNVLDFIEGNKYLGIVYHSTLMQPRIRNGKYTFYYNDTEYSRTKYDQKINNLPVFAYDDQSIELRDDLLINSMDKWNDWYAEKYQKNDNTYTGVLSLYGNGYTQILESNAKDIEINNKFLSVSEVKSLNNEYINMYSGINEVNIEPMKQDEPNNGEYFRGFLYDINWEFPYYDKQGIIPYRIVSAFDNFLNNNTSTNGELTDDTSAYKDYYNALTDLTDSSYGTNMIPYTLLYDIEPRIAYNYETKGINAFMLRRPSIGTDTDHINNLTEFKEKYEFNRRLFNLSSNPEKLKSPYNVK